MQAKRHLCNVFLHKCLILVTLNQPKSNLFAGISDTLKREPSESVANKSARANQSVSSSFPIGTTRKKPPLRVAFVFIGYLRHPKGAPRRAAQAQLARANPKVAFLASPDKVTTKKATRLGGIRGDLIGTRTRVCAVRGRRPNR